jgi:hypothetical protein
MEVRNLQDNGPDAVAWRWTWEIKFEDGSVRSYATNNRGEGLFDCDDNYKQLKGCGQFSLSGKTLGQARSYILRAWHTP